MLQLIPPPIIWSTRVIDMVASHLPGRQAMEAMLTTEADQVLNNDINTEVNKGFGGIINDIEGTFNRDQ